MFFGRKSNEDKNPKEHRRKREKDKHERDNDRRDRPREEESKKDQQRRDYDKKEEDRRADDKRDKERIDKPKEDEKRKEQPKREEDKREQFKKDDNKKEQPKIEEDRKEQSKKDDDRRMQPKKEEDRREQPKKEEDRREQPKTDEYKMNQPKKEEDRREQPKTDDDKKEPLKKDDDRREQPTRDEDRRKQSTRDENEKEQPVRGEERSDKPKEGEYKKDDEFNDKNFSDNKTDFSEKRDSENKSDEYDMRSTDYSSDKEVKSSFFSGIVRIIASSPIIVSTLSLSHIIVDIKPIFLIGGLIFISIHYIISFCIIAKVSEEDYAPTDSLSSLTYNTVYPLSLLIDIYLVILKFLTSIFYVDMIFEIIYSFIPDYRLDDLSFGFSKSFILMFMVLLFIIVLLVYRLLENLRLIFECILIFFSISLLVCIIFYSILGISEFEDNASAEGEGGFASMLFLTFAFLSFSMECQSVSVRSFKSSNGKSFIISAASVSFISIFFALFLYFGRWIPKKSLSEVLEITITSTSKINRSLKSNRTDRFNLLPKVTTISFFINGIIGYLINVSILGKSLIQSIPILNKGSSIFEVIIIFIMVFLIVFLVVLRDIGRVLWLSTKIIFYGFPLFAMYPYISFFGLENKSKIFFVVSLLGLFLYISLFFLGFFVVPKLGPK